MQSHVENGDKRTSTPRSAVLPKHLTNTDKGETAQVFANNRARDNLARLSRSGLRSLKVRYSERSP